MTNSTTTINDLPQLILIHILSFLYLPEAIQTSLVSRTFLNLWQSLPSLNFDIFQFYSRNHLPNPRSDESRSMFVEFVSQTLLFRRIHLLTKLQLMFEYTNFEEHKFHVQSWIRYAINSYVYEIDIDLCPFKYYRWDDEDEDADEEGHRLCYFDFRLLDIVDSCVKVLKLSTCYLTFPPSSNPIKFISLKSIQLKGNQSIDICDLLARCVNLETLKLINKVFYAEEGLRIYSATLKEVYLDSCLNANRRCPLDLEICCPSLRKISLITCDIGKYVNKDTTLLVEAWVDFLPFHRRESNHESWEIMLRYFSNITSFRVWEELLESREVPAGCEQLASNLKHLELYCAYNENDLVGLAALLKLLPKLEILGLRRRGVSDENLGKKYIRASTVFNMPCLKKVILRKYLKTKFERHFIKLFRKSGIVLEKIELLHFNEEEDKQHEGTIRLERRVHFARG